MNQYESRAIAEKLCEAGLNESTALHNCDLYIINTCAVTSESARKSRQMIRRARSSADDPVVIAVGCWTELEPEKAAGLGCADYIMGTGEKSKICDKALELLEKRGERRLGRIDIAPKNEYDVFKHTVPESVREYLKIEDGCNGKCAYCIIPTARGPVRSRDPEDAFHEAEALAKNGVRELILTGIELSGYQYDLAALVERIAGIPEIQRIRFGSWDPSYLKQGFVSKLAEIEKVTPHFHLSIQSGCSRTLAAMRRKYNADTAMETVSRLREHFPDVMLTCDLIVGFPGETDEDFAQTLEFMRNARFLHAHIFPYSIRPGTEAAKMPDQIDKSVKEMRLHAVESLQREITSVTFNGIISSGKPLHVLVESEENGVIHGHSENFISVCAEGSKNTVGRIVPVIPERFSGEEVYGKIKNQ